MNTPASFELGRNKRLVAGALHYSGVSRLLTKLNLPSNGYVRAINYHQTLPENATNFERHLALYRRHFVGVSRDDLSQLLKTGTWKHDKPGLLLGFDDGMKSNYEVAAPLLEKYGFVGWFYVPAGLIDCPPTEQRAFADAHDLPGALVETPASDGRYAMTWDQLGDLVRRGHVVGSHTMTHRRMSSSLTAEELRREIVDSKALIEQKLGSACDSFCWVGGEETSYSAEAAKVIAGAGYTFGFQTNAGLTTRDTHPLQINRTNIEDRWPISMVTFQLSGIVDRKYAAKRDRIERLTRT